MTEPTEDERHRALVLIAEAEGFTNIDDLISFVMKDTAVVPGICLDEDCGATASVEGDQREGYCDVCGKNSVVSALVLASLI